MSLIEKFHDVILDPKPSGQGNTEESPAEGYNDD